MNKVLVEKLAAEARDLARAKYNNCTIPTGLFSAEVFQQIFAELVIRECENACTEYEQSLQETLLGELSEQKSIAAHLKILLRELLVKHRGNT